MLTLRTYRRQSDLLFQLTDLAAAARRMALGTALLAPVLALAQTTSATTNNDASTALPTVTVTGASDNGLKPVYAGGQVARGGSLGVLGTQDVMDTPFSTVNYTAESMKDQQARTVADVVTNDASVRNQNSAGGFGDAYQIRGFSVSIDDTAFNGLYGLVSLGRTPVNMLERVEVLKGPGTFTGGMGPAGSVGGAINLVSKRAGDEPVSSFTATYLSDSQFGGQVDLARRFGQNKEWGIRVNAGYADGNTGLTGSNQQQTMGALALDYTTSKLRWTLDAYTTHEDSKNFRPQLMIGTSSMPAAPSGDINVYPGTAMQLDDKVIATRLEYDLNDKLTAYGAVGYHVASSAQNFVFGSVTNLQGDIVGAYGTGSNNWYDQTATTTSADVGLRARFDTFGIGHSVTLGVSSFDKQLDYFYGGGGDIATNLYSPSAYADPTGSRGVKTPASQTRQTSVALTDTLSVANGRVLVTGGVRRQQAYAHSFSSTDSDVNNHGYSPLLAVVVKPLERVSLYANYTVGLSAGEVVAAPANNAGQVLAPYKATQYETGAKVDWGRVMTNVALFEINKANSVTDPTTNVTSQDGRVRVRGLELSAVGEVQRGLRLMAGATFFDPKQYHTASGTNDGKEVNGVPRHNYNLGLDWDMPWLAGASLNSRMIHTGKMYYDANNSVEVPAWTRVDLGARYVSKLAGKTVTYRFNVENLFDRKYWIVQGSYVGAAPSRGFVASAQVDF